MTRLPAGMNALPRAPDRTHEHSVADRGSWWEQHVVTTIVRIGGELRKVTGRASDQATAFQNCKTAALRHEGQP